MTCEIWGGRWVFVRMDGSVIQPGGDVWDCRLVFVRDAA